jgi:histone H3/H4
VLNTNKPFTVRTITYAGIVKAKQLEATANTSMKQLYVTTANTSTCAVSNKDVSVLLAKRRALRKPTPSKSQPSQHPSMQHSLQQRGSTSSSSSSAARSNKSKTVNQKDIIALLARRRAILAR